METVHQGLREKGRESMEMVREKPYFIHRMPPCRDNNYKESWMCRTGNVVTYSTVSLSKCIKAHLKKINK